MELFRPAGRLNSVELFNLIGRRRGAETDPRSFRWCGTAAKTVAARETRIRKCNNLNFTIGLRLSRV